jgi:hypothetical protein
MIGLASHAHDSAMKIVFTKGPAKHDFMDIHRECQPIERVECPKQRIIPHDMVHYAVEHTLQTRGFLGRVKEGERAGFQMTAEAESDAVERLVEVFQGDEWSGGTTSASDMIAMYRVTCQARGCPQLELDDEAIMSVRASIAELTSRWSAVEVGGSLELHL